MLAHILSDYNKDFPLIEIINKYEEITDEYNKRFYTCPRPCAVEFPDKSIHVFDFKTLVYVDLSRALFNLGNTYKVPVNAISYIEKWKGNYICITL